MKDKKALRQEILAIRNSIDKNQKQEWDNSICENLSSLLLHDNLQVVHTFLPMPHEVNIYPFIDQLLEKKIKVVTPKTERNRTLKHLELKSLDELEEGIFGTQHPANSQEYIGEYDLILVPGVAFDQRYNRLGYGVGYYDNFLKEHQNVKKWALCYPFQIVDEVPIEIHDVMVNKIISPII